MNNLKKNQSGFTLIEILVVIGMIALLATVVLIAINPARQFAQARNTQRSSNINAILNAIGQNIADNKGVIPAAITTTPTDMGSGAGQIDICSTLMPTYIPSLPSDPNQSGPFTSCTTYDTGYNVSKDATGRITVTAPSTEVPPATAILSVTR